MRAVPGFWCLKSVCANDSRICSVAHETLAMAPSLKQGTQQLEPSCTCIAIQLIQLLPVWSCSMSRARRDCCYCADSSAVDETSFHVPTGADVQFNAAPGSAFTVLNPASPGGPGGPVPWHPPRPAVRLPGPQRRRQDDHAEHPGRPPDCQRRRGPHRRRAGRRRRGPPPPRLLPAGGVGADLV